jgi:hypothetical protein
MPVLPGGRSLKRVEAIHSFCETAETVSLSVAILLEIFGFRLSSNVAWVVLVISDGARQLYGRREKSLSNIKSEEERRKVAELYERAALAESETAALQIDVADARERQAQAEQLIAWLRSDKRPRWATFNLLTFIGLLKREQTGKAEILYQTEDPEAALFASHIAEGLGRVGWTVAPPVSIPPSSGQFPNLLLMGANAVGISILVRTIPEGEDGSPFRALLGTLSKMEVLASARPDPALPEDTVRIIVGPKP